MDTETVLAASALQPAQEDDPSIGLAHAYIIILYAGEAVLHLVEFVVMGGKEGACPASGMLVDVLHNGPGNADAVVGAGAASKLIEEHKRAAGEVVEDAGGLVHLHHEGALALGDVVAGANAGEDFVHKADARAVGWHKTSHLCHEHDEGCLAQKGALTSHVGSGDDDNLLLLCVQLHIVGHIAFAHGHLLLNDGMAPLTDVYHIALVHNGTDVAVLGGTDGKGEQAVELCHQCGVGLDGGGVAGKRLDQGGIEPRFQCKDFFLGSHYLFFIVLEFLGDVALGVDQRLLAYPLGRHLVLVGVAHFQIVAKDIVVANLEALDAGGLCLALLDLEQVVLALIGNLAKLIQLGTDALGYDTALCGKQGRVGGYLAGNAVAYLLTEGKVLAHVTQGGIVCLAAGFLYGREGLKRHPKLYHIPRRDAAHADLAHNAFQIANAQQLFLHQRAEVGMAEEAVHHVLSATHLGHVLEGEHDPAAQHSGAHGSDGLVYDIEQGDSALVHGTQQFQAADGELVQSYKAVFLNAAEGGDVAQLVVLREFHILEDYARRHNSGLEVFHTEALEVLHLEVLEELASGGGLGKGPVVHLVGDKAGAEGALEHSALSALKEHLLGLETVQQLVCLVCRSLGNEELARADVQQGQSAHGTAKMDRRQKVVLLAVEDGIVHGHAWGHQFCDASLDQGLGELGVFKLVADGHPSASPHQSGKIGVQRMVGKSGHGRGRSRAAIVATGKGYAQYLAGRHRIVCIRFIEVAAPEKQQRIGVLCLEVVKLLHHGGESVLCHIYKFLVYSLL